MKSPLIKMKPKTKCLNPACKNHANSRGLCISCYNTASRLIQKGKTTWLAMERRGVCKKKSNTSQRVEWLLGLKS